MIENNASDKIDHEKPKVSIVIQWYTKIRSAIGVCLVLPHTALSSTLVVIAGLCGGYHSVTVLIHYWALGALYLFGIRLHVTGENYLPQKGGGIILFNHQSLFDIPVVCASTLNNIRFGAKIELFSVPFFGAAMRASGTLPIVRENRGAVMQIYKEAQSRFEKNILFVLAPEGTRQKTAEIGRFKKGPFQFAMNAGVPLIPVVIKGAHAVLPKNSLSVNIGQLRRVIHVEYLKPVPTAGLNSDSLDELVDKVRASMVDTFARLPDSNIPD